MNLFCRNSVYLFYLLKICYSLSVSTVFFLNIFFNKFSGLIEVERIVASFKKTFSYSCFDLLFKKFKKIIKFYVNLIRIIVEFDLKANIYSTKKHSNIII